MSLLFSERVTQIKPSASIAARQKVVELHEAGRHIIDFTIGEPDLDTPSHVVNAAIDALRNGTTHYTATAGTPALRAAICRKFERENSLHYSPDEVVVGNGAKQLICEALAATVRPGDEVIVPAPYWVSYPDMVRMNSGIPVIAACDEAAGFKLAPGALEAAITEKTRWIIINSPNNPTGAVYLAHELEALADVLRRHPHVWVLIDDIYEHLIYDGERHINLLQVDPALRSRSLLVNGVSKAYSMTGWRLGYAAGPLALIKAIITLLGQATTCVSSISQAAAVAALDGSQACVQQAVQSYRERRDRMLGLLDGVPGIHVLKPKGAFYLFLSVAGLIGCETPQGTILKTDSDVSLYLLDAAGVAVLDGAAYGLSPYLRLSYATSVADIEEGCRKIRTACEALF